MLDAGQLVALRSIRNNALQADVLPSRLKLLNWGTNESTEGKVILDDQSAQIFAANQKLIGRERIALDFEHNTVPGTEEFKRSQEPRDVAAYGAPVVIPGDGLYLEAITWTPAGQKSSRNYEDLSPAPFRTSEGRVIGLHSAALTRAGAVTGLHFFSATPETDKLLTTLSAHSNTPPLHHSTMTNLSLTGLAKALGLKPEADEAAVLAKLTTLNAQVEALGVLLKDGKIVPLTAGSDPGMALIENRLTAIEAGQTNSERNRLILDAARDGKVIPLSAEDLKTVPITVLSAMVKNLPATVPLSARGRVTETTPAAAPDRSALIQTAVAKHRAATNSDYHTAYNAVRAAEPALFS